MRESFYDTLVCERDIYMSSVRFTHHIIPIQSIVVQYWVIYISHDEENAICK